MVSDSNYWLIAADGRQYFFIEYRNLPSETIGVPPLARAIVPSGTARKAAGELWRLRPVGQTGLRVEVILRLPEATLQGYRGKSGGRLDAFHPPFPSPAVLEAQRTPPGERPPEVKNH